MIEILSQTALATVQDIGRFGSLQFSSNYTNMLKRELQPQLNDPFLDLLGNMGLPTRVIDATGDHPI